MRYIVTRVDLLHQLVRYDLGRVIAVLKFAIVDYATCKLRGYTDRKPHATIGRT